MVAFYFDISTIGDIFTFSLAQTQYIWYTNSVGFTLLFVSLNHDRLLSAKMQA